jgi:diamine N-acetyltransferase
VTFIKNKHISLRALEKEDLPYLYRLENKESARQHGDSLMPLSKYVLKDFITNADKDIFQTRQLRLVIEHNANCEAIGMVDMFDFSPHHQRAEVGIWIDEAYRENGFASEALESLSTFAFETLLINQLFCHINVENKASITLFKNAGFNKIGILKQWTRTKNNFNDVAVFQKIKTP